MEVARYIWSLRFVGMGWMHVYTTPMFRGVIAGVCWQELSVCREKVFHDVSVGRCGALMHESV